MEECSLEPDDGQVEKSTCWGAIYKEYSDAADHSMLDAIAEDDDITEEMMTALRRIAA